MRLGPFDLESDTGLEAVYTTNVEGERPSEATAEREDYYLVWDLNLSSTAELTERTRLDLGTGIAIEKHFVRKDLDNSQSPFGLIALGFETDLDPLKIYGAVEYERSSDSTDDMYAPSRLQRKGRQVGSSLEYNLGADWIATYYEVGASYEVTRERYDESRYEAEEKNDTSFKWYVQLLPLESISVRYEKEYTFTELINVPGEEEEDETETIEIIFNKLFSLIERPEINYMIGVERNYEDGETDGWELIHTLLLSDEIQLNSSTFLKYYAEYTYEDDPEEDDISFIYGVTFDQDISETISHTLSLTREPVATLGSTDDTDKTEYGYSIIKSDFFVYNLDLSFDVTYTIDRPPPGDPVEKKMDYSLSLQHDAIINSSLTRIISYEYTRESSNQEDEILDEHRVTWAYEFKF